MEEDVELRAATQAVVLEHRRRYGYRRVTLELHDRGWLVNHKRVARLMKDDNLLAVQPRAWVTTTNSNHPLQVYLNLAMRMNVTGINQLWVADITYIRLAEEFVFLAVVLDVYSRKVAGWELGLVHHSDRGLQYCHQLKIIFQQLEQGRHFGPYRRRSEGRWMAGSEYE